MVPANASQLFGVDVAKASRRNLPGAPLGAGIKDAATSKTPLLCSVNSAYDTTEINDRQTKVLPKKSTAGIFTHKLPKSTDHFQAVGKSVGLDWTGTGWLHLNFVRPRPPVLDPSCQV
jgi:hypothetical protein